MDLKKSEDGEQILCDSEDCGEEKRTDKRNDIYLLI